MLDYDAPTLVLVAHPDDESIGMGITLQRLNRALVVFCTSGAPLFPPVWLRYGTPWHYGRVREREAVKAVQAAGSNAVEFLRFQDGRTYRDLAAIYLRVKRLVETFRPQVIVTHALEGAHQDHDVCSFIGARVAERLALETWEIALYYKSASTGQVVRNEFKDEWTTPEVVKASDYELVNKRKMLDAHQSQKHIIGRFDPMRELIRRQTRDADYAVALDRMPNTTVDKTPVAKVLMAFKKFKYPTDN
jgi:N-acetylglucosamine malate deacetylase 2